MEKKWIIIYTIVGLMTIFGATALVTNNGNGTITLSYTMTTTDAQELQEAICHNHNYQTEIEDDINGGFINNPESCQSFAQRQIKSYFNQHINAYRYYQAEQQINTGEDILIS